MRELVDVLNEKRIAYTVCGANALSVYSARPRTTIDIDVFIDSAQRHDIESAMIDSKFAIVYISASHSKFVKHGVEIDLLYAGNAAERWGISSAYTANILGVGVKSATPEALLWLYVLSMKDQNTVDAIELLKSVNVDIDFVLSQLDTVSDRAKLQHIVARSQQAENTRRRLDK